MLKYSGANFLRQRLILSTISGRALKISDIRLDDEDPGLRPFEASLLRLLDKVTDNAHIQIDETGTSLYYRPGVIIGGEDLAHDCGTSRCVTYFLEALLCVCLFGKNPLKITLKGLTNDNKDPSVDTFRTVTLPTLRHFGVSDGLSLAIKKRGCVPDGGGEVFFTCPIVKKIEPFQLVKEGRTKRVRGVAYTTRLSQQFGVQVVDKARELLNDFLPDVWVYTDHCKGDRTGNSPGYGLSLVSETIQGHAKGAGASFDESFQKLIGRATGGGTKKELSYSSASASGGQLRNLLEEKGLIEDGGEEEDQDEEMGEGEDEGTPKLSDFSEPQILGRVVASRLLWEIQQGGVVDSQHQHLAMLFMALADEHAACKIKLGRLSLAAVQFLRHLKDFLGVSFALENAELEDEEGKGQENGKKAEEEGDEDAESEEEEDEEEMKQKAAPPPPPGVLLSCVGIGLRNVARKSF